MKTLIMAVALTVIAGCATGPSPLDIARQEIKQQYAELEQINDLNLRRQKFLEIQQRENILETQAIAQDQAAQAAQQYRANLWSNYMLYQGLTKPKTYNVNMRRW